MEAIILAGGFGIRLRNVVPNLPKPMAPVAGKPFVEHVLLSLSKKGFSRVILSVGFMAEKIISYFGNNFYGIEIVYAIEKSPLGTGGAIVSSMLNCRTDHVYIFNGDSYINLEINEIEALWELNHNPIIIARNVIDTSRYGRIESKNGQIIAFSEKGTHGPGLINAGCYLFPVGLLKDIPQGKSFSIENDYFAKEVSKKSFDLFITKGYFIDIGLPEDYARAQVELQSEFDQNTI